MTKPPPASNTTFSGYADAQAGTRHVFVSNLEVLTIIGVHDAEKRAPQRVIATVDLKVRETGQTRTDRLVDVLDYAEVVRLVERLTRQGHVNLLETLAERIAEGCLADGRVLAVRVRLEKPDVIPNARAVGIEIERVAKSKM
jgi:7,8-dihydroneopterin aldolase/epimerase/oxygenase